MIIIVIQFVKQAYGYGRQGDGMFGHQNNDQQHDADAHHSDVQQSPAAPPSDFNPALPTPGTGFGATTVTPQTDNAGSNNAGDAGAPAPASHTNDLLDIKQQALGQLSPLVDHLEQSPEEKFRTTMMMIQASDNQDLIKDAYAAAQAIPDEKIKAQALLDIVNEINYFTQHQS